MNVFIGIPQLKVPQSDSRQLASGNADGPSIGRLGSTAEVRNGLATSLAMR